MNREELIDLANRILRKEASEADIKIYNEWFNSFQQSGEQPVADEEKKKAELYNRVSMHIDRETPVRKIARQTTDQTSRWLLLAAAVATMVLGVYFFNTPFQSDKDEQATSLAGGVTDIRPGRNTATLTLANGKEITLSDAKKGVVIDVAGLKYNDETAVTSASIDNAKGGGIMTITTPRGGTYQVILSDGSRIWLNAASTIKFPANFAGSTERRVELVGEAYFEISKSKSQKFIVVNRNQQVEVLGTHFNINSYVEEVSVKTTLLEGSVKVSKLLASRALSAKPNSSKVLLPGQQSKTSEEDNIEVKEVDVNDVVAWKEGKFVFVRENVTSIMNKIARWYDVEIVYEGNVKNKALGGSVSRFKNVSEVLEMLSATNAVQFKIVDRKVIVMPFKGK